MRTARKLWVTLVTLGSLFVLASTATGLTALVFPQWIDYKKSIDLGLSAELPRYRGLFNSCNGTFDKECQEISNPTRKALNCTQTSGESCSSIQQTRFTQINNLRLLNWALPTAALGLEALVTIGCVAYLVSVRYCLTKPSAQKAQGCLVGSGFLLWVAAIVSVLGTISFEWTLMTESITRNLTITGITGNLRKETWQGIGQASYGLSSHLGWASPALAMVASWLWILASFVQPPPHITSTSAGKMLSSSTVPLYPIMAPR